MSQYIILTAMDVYLINWSLINLCQHIDRKSDRSIVTSGWNSFCHCLLHLMIYLISNTHCMNMQLAICLCSYCCLATFISCMSFKSWMYFHKLYVSLRVCFCFLSLNFASKNLNYISMLKIATVVSNVQLLSFIWHEFPKCFYTF